MAVVVHGVASHEGDSAGMFDFIEASDVAMFVVVTLLTLMVFIGEIEE